MTYRQAYTRGDDTADLVDRLRELELRVARLEADLRRVLQSLGLRL